MSGRRFHIIACHVIWRELCYFASQSAHVFTFTFLKQGLHDTPDELRLQLQEAIAKADQSCEAILLGYGLCSNGIVGIRAHNIPLVVIRGHDCITFFLGSKERYQSFFDAHPGTYWYTPGWIETCNHPMPGEERLETLRREYIEKYGEENAQYLLEMEHHWIHKYHVAAYTDLGIGDRRAYMAYTRECADFLGWQFMNIDGDASLIRDFVSGKWSEKRFLLVPPNHEIVASHNEQIIKVKKYKTD